MKNSLLCLLLLTFATVFAQEQLLAGRVVIDSTGLGGAFVINKQTGAEVKTAYDGSFSIAVKPGQKLVVTSGSTDVREFFVDAASFARQPYTLAVEPKSYELDAVVIDQKLTPEALGIVPKGQKVYTPAQKKEIGFQTAQHGLTGFLNWMRGKKFLLEIEEKYAGKRVALETLNGMYTETELRVDLGIPAQYTEAFMFYAVDDAKLYELLRARRHGEARMLVPDVALRYLQTITTNETDTLNATDGVPAANGTAAPAPSGEGNGQ
jgi:hypothetical protein